MVSSAQAGASSADGDIRGDELNVLVNGERWTGWTSVEVIRTLDTAAGRFKIGIPPMRGTTWPLRPGDEVEIALGDEDTLLDGIVDDLRATSESQNRMVSVSGRDRTAVLVDCSVDLDVYEWKDQTLRQIVEDITKPFLIKIGDIATQVFESFDLFACSSTDKAWPVIERACRQKGLLAFSQPDGKLSLLRPPGFSTAVDLIEGENIIKSRFRWGTGDRYSTYRVEGQHSGSDAGWGDSIISLSGEARDLEIGAHRPLTIRAEQGMTPEDCRRRAEWEATFRRARALALEILVPGWRQGVGTGNPPWSVNTVPFASIPSMGLEGSWLISRVRFARDKKGSAKTQLELVPPDSFQPKPEIEKLEMLNGFLISEEDEESEF